MPDNNNYLGAFTSIGKQNVHKYTYTQNYIKASSILHEGSIIPNELHPVIVWSKHNQFISKLDSINYRDICFKYLPIVWNMKWAYLNEILVYIN